MRADKVTTTVRPVGWLRKGCGVLVWSAIGGAIGGGGGAAIDSALKPTSQATKPADGDTVQGPQSQTWGTQPWWKWGLGLGSSVLLTGFGIYRGKLSREKEVAADIKAMREASTKYGQLVSQWNDDAQEIENSLTTSKTTLEYTVNMPLGQFHEVYDNVHAVYRKLEEALSDTYDARRDLKNCHEALKKLNDTIKDCSRKNEKNIPNLAQQELLNLCSIQDETAMTNLYDRLQEKLNHARKTNELYKKYVDLEIKHYNIRANQTS